ncbi:MAG: CIA30 family protein [Rhodospirillaceae bacterium]|nr:CIA30 family protein [Rhodospirillaceae bacterium]
MTKPLGRRVTMAAAISALILPFARHKALAAADQAPASATPLVLDDFTGPGGIATIGTRWAGFTDRVMGGRSNAQAAYDVIDGRRCLRMKGRVSTDGGGFIQLALDLEMGQAPLDASAYAGIEMDFWGNGEDYNCHLRTTDVRWYEQSYRATMASKPEWTTVRLPWSAFTPHGLTTLLNLKGLMRLGLLGWMRDFDADFAVSRVALYTA